MALEQRRVAEFHGKTLDEVDWPRWCAMFCFSVFAIYLLLYDLYRKFTGEWQRWQQDAWDKPYWWWHGLYCQTKTFFFYFSKLAMCLSQPVKVHEGICVKYSCFCSGVGFLFVQRVFFKRAINKGACRNDVKQNHIIVLWNQMYWYFCVFVSSNIDQTILKCHITVILITMIT